METKNRCFPLLGHTPGAYAAPRVQTDDPARLVQGLTIRPPIKVIFFSLFFGRRARRSRSTARHGPGSRLPEPPSPFPEVSLQRRRLLNDP